MEIKSLSEHDVAEQVVNLIDNVSVALTFKYYLSVAFNICLIIALLVIIVYFIKKIFKDK